MSRKVLMVLVVPLLLTAPYASSDEVRIRADVWCPYNCTPKSAMPGYMIEIAQQAFAVQGYQIDYQVMPWARAIKETRLGKLEAIVGAYVEDAPDFVFPKNHLGYSASILVGKPDLDWNYQGINSLESIKMGVILDYAYGEDIDNYIKKNQEDPARKAYVQPVSGDNALEQNVKKLLSGRIDVLIANELVFKYYLKKSGLSMNQFKKVGAPATDKVYIAFSPKLESSAKYANILDEGLTSLRASGKLQVILDKYGVEDWDK